MIWYIWLKLELAKKIDGRKMLVHNLDNHRQLSFKFLLIMQELHEYIRIACVHYIISIHVIIQLIDTG